MPQTSCTYQCKMYIDSGAPQPRRGHAGFLTIVNNWTNGWKCLWRGHSIYQYRPLIPLGFLLRTIVCLSFSTGSFLSAHPPAVGTELGTGLVGGWGTDITVVVCGRYCSLFEHQGWLGPVGYGDPDGSTPYMPCGRSICPCVGIPPPPTHGGGAGLSLFCCTSPLPSVVQVLSPSPLGPDVCDFKSSSHFAVPFFVGPCVSYMTSPDLCSVFLPPWQP